MKYIIGFLLGVLLGACASTPAPRVTHGHVESAATLEAVTVAIVVDSHVCSGVWVSQTRIATANHCVDDLEAGDPLAYATHGDLYPKLAEPLREVTEFPVRLAFVVARDIDHDLAIVEDPDPPKAHGIASLRAEPIEAGMFAQGMGHPKGLWFSYSSGDVAAVREKDVGDGRLLVWVQSTAPISPGCSGGGLFDYDGRLIGIATAVVNGAANIGLFVPVGYVRRLLAKP